MNREDFAEEVFKPLAPAVDHPTWPQTAQRRSPAARGEAICGPGSDWPTLALLDFGMS